MKFEKYLNDDNFYITENNEIFINEGIIDWIKKKWTSLKSFISNAFKHFSKKLLPGEEIVFNISKKLNECFLTEYAISSIKGNYNEALVCTIINETIKTLDKQKYSREINDTFKAKENWGNQFNTWKKQQDDIEQIDKIIYEIEQGSIEMARYIIGNANSNDMVIKAAWVDNLDAATKGSEFKADIKIALEKNGKEIYDKYSLKLYTGWEVSLINTTPTSLLKALFGNKAENDLKQTFINDSDLTKAIENARVITKILNSKTNFPSSRLIEIYNLKDILSDEELKKLENCKNIREVKKNLRELRTPLRTPINRKIAKLTYDVMITYFNHNKKQFAENLLKIIGFKDHETKLLMAVIEKNKTINILDKHPELDLENLEIILSGVSIIIRNEDKIIFKFNTKEGEKKSVTGKLLYNRKKSVDLDNYSDIDLPEILGI